MEEIKHLFFQDISELHKKRKLFGDVKQQRTTKIDQTSSPPLNFRLFHKGKAACLLTADTQQKLSENVKQTLREHFFLTHKTMVTSNLVRVPICTAAQGTEETALMEPEEQIYVNIQEVGDYRAKHQRPRETETKPVRTDAVAREETETWSLLKVAAVCLALLCFLLLTTVIGVGVLYDRDFNQLSRDLSNQTAEKDQLLVRYQNLTKKIGTCPDGWTQFGCSCYFLSTTTNTWSSSRQACVTQGADLVIIDSKREMLGEEEKAVKCSVTIISSQK
ncbi:C-type lectin domain family 4 member C [Collichthys lucidus]|uniref:C-type lectin domain family 4 member C n=1 Tax=Collichthys lucidus TaxID=240159 RepID=A0A4U5U554_COLLU|nr:C-type lectin domain family 4 member C [Collichthys lucidus]